MTAKFFVQIMRDKSGIEIIGPTGDERAFDKYQLISGEHQPSNLLSSSGKTILTRTYPNSCCIYPSNNGCLRIWNYFEWSPDNYNSLQYWIRYK